MLSEEEAGDSAEVDGVVAMLLSRSGLASAAVGQLERTASCSGVYVLGLANRAYYVGESGNIAKRIGQHAREKQIEQVWLRRVAVKARRAMEIRLLQTLEAAGAQVANIDGARRSVSPLPFDDLMPLVAQQLWVDAATAAPDAPARHSFEPERMRMEVKFRRFQQTPGARDAITFLEQFVRHHVPVPGLIEGRNLSVSCMPQTRVLLRVNAARQEVAAVARLDSGALFFKVQGPLLTARRTLARLAGRHRGLELDHEVWYEAGGPDQAQIGSTSLREILNVLGDSVYGVALRRFNLALFRQGSSLWGKSHCPQLLDGIL